MKGDCIETKICDRLYKLRAYIKSRCGQGVQAEDIYGDVVVKMWKIIRNEKYKEGFSIDAFMMTCAKSVMCDYYKKENRSKRTYSDEYDYYFNVSTRSPEKAYEAHIENNIFMKKIGKLRAICRKVLILSLFQNMKHWEIADTLGISRIAVSTHMFRMRKEFGNIHLNKVRP